MINLNVYCVYIRGYVFVCVYIDRFLKYKNNISLMNFIYLFLDKLMYRNCNNMYLNERLRSLKLLLSYLFIFVLFKWKNIYFCLFYFSNVRF